MPKNRIIKSKEEKLEEQIIDLLVENDFPTDQIEIFMRLPLPNDKLLETAHMLIKEYNDKEKEIKEPENSEN